MPTLGEKLYEHRLAGRFCDIELIPNDSTIGIKCHKLVLMASSEYFSCMFSSGMRETSAQTVTLADCRSEVLTMLIDFFYKSERPQGVTCDNVLELFSWGIRCDLPNLCEHCWDFIRNSLGPDNAFSVLSFAVAHHLNKIKKECILLIQRQFALLHDAEEWMDLSYDTLKDIFSYQMLRVFHEDRVLEILIRWIRLHADRKDLLSSINVENLSEAALEKYKDFVRSINYVPEEPAARTSSFHVHLMLQYKHDSSLLPVVCVTNRNVEVYRYPEIDLTDHDRNEQYRVDCCTTHTDRIIVGACRNLSIFTYSFTQRQVVFSENFQIYKGAQNTVRQAVVADIASVNDSLWALIVDQNVNSPRLACYMPNLNVWDMEFQLPSDVHRILDNSSPRSNSGVYVLKKCGTLMQIPAANQRPNRVASHYVSLGKRYELVDCEGLVVPDGFVLVHGRDSAGDFYTSCYDERKKEWKRDAIRLYHDQTLDYEEVLTYQLFREGTGLYLVEEWSSGSLTLHEWAPQEVRWNMLKVFKEPRTRFVGAIHRNSCDADAD